MYIESEARDFSDGLHHGRAEGQIGDEMTVHDVDVKQVCAALLHPLDLVRQPGEVGREDGWNNLDICALTLILSRGRGPRLVGANVMANSRR